MTVLMLDCQVDSVVPPVVAHWLSGGAAIRSRCVRGSCKLNERLIGAAVNYTHYHETRTLNTNYSERWITRLMGR